LTINAKMDRYQSSRNSPCQIFLIAGRSPCLWCPDSADLSS